MEVVANKLDIQEITSIVWDWNGTLINDTEICLKAVNELLKIRNLPTISLQKYLEEFTFPVESFYKTLGFNFNKESFSDLSFEYMGHYLTNFRAASLHVDAINAIRFFKNDGKIQYILSAMEKEDLSDGLYKKGIKHYFRSVYGLDNNQAGGKRELIKRFLQKERLLPHQTLIIGDTIHDYEISELTGCQAVLIANGHQSFERLKYTGAHVFQSLTKLIDYLV